MCLIDNSTKLLNIGVLLKFFERIAFLANVEFQSSELHLIPDLRDYLELKNLLEISQNG